MGPVCDRKRGQLNCPDTLQVLLSAAAMHCPWTMPRGKKKRTQTCTQSKKKEEEGISYLVMWVTGLSKQTVTINRFVSVCMERDRKWTESLREAIRVLGSSFQQLFLRYPLSERLHARIQRALYPKVTGPLPIWMKACQKDHDISRMTFTLHWNDIRKLDLEPLLVCNYEGFQYKRKDVWYGLLNGKCIFVYIKQNECTKLSFLQEKLKMLQ